MCNDSIVNRSVSRFANFIYTYRVSFISTLIFGLLAYLFAFTNKLPNWDDIHGFYTNIWGFAGFGRWMTGPVDSFFPWPQASWICGFISVLIIAVVNSIISFIFKIENKFIQAFLSGVIVSCPSVVSFMAYMVSSDSNAVCFLLSVLPVYFYQKGGWKNIALACISLVLSLAIYQAFLGVTVSLFLVLFLKSVVLDKEKSAKDILSQGVKYICFLIVTVGIYLIVNKIIFMLFGLEFNTYSTNSLSSDLSIPKRIIVIYASMVNLLVGGTYGFVNTITARITHYILIVLCGYWMIANVLRGRDFKKLSLLVLGIILFPVALNHLILVAPSGSHSMTLLGFISVYVLFALTIQDLLSHHNFKLYDISIVCIAVLLVNAVYVSNKIQFMQYMQYQEAYSYWTRVVNRIEQNPNFNQQSKVAIIGKAGNLVHDYSSFNAPNIAGIKGGHILNYYSRIDFIKHYIGFEAKYADKNEIESVMKTKQFQQMHIYPYFGSVKKIGNIIVVKLSNDKEFKD